MAWVCRPNSATAAGRNLAPCSGNPAVNDIGSTATAIVRIYINGLGGAVLSAGATFHAGVFIGDVGFSMPDSKDAVWADQLAIAATDAFFL